MIQAAKTKDIKYLLEIERLCFQDDDVFNYFQFHYLINKGKGIFLVFTLAYKPAGYVYALKNGHIYSIAVHPALQGLTIGKCLLNAIEDHFKNIPKVILEVREDNIQARLFYEKHGYKIYGIRQNYYLDGTDAILMEKDMCNAERRLAQASDTL